MAETLDIVNKFLTDVRLKLRCQFINRACKHKVLPYHQAQLVTEIEEPVFRIIAASPDTYCIKVRSFTLKKQFSGTLSGCSLKQIILRNIVRTHGKYLITGYFVGKALTPLIFLYVHGQRTETDFSAPGVHNLVTGFQVYLYLI